MAVAENPARVRLAGGRLERGGRPWVARGVCYGPFPTDAATGWLPDAGAMARDLDRMAAIGINALRLFHPPTETLVALAAERNLSVWGGLPWGWQTDFCSQPATVHAALEILRRAVLRWRDTPCVVGWAVANEIEATLVRWCGYEATRQVLERLISAGHDLAPEALFFYANYPPTEWLLPDNADLAALNIYLDTPEKLRAYLRRAHHFAAGRPLLVSEFGVDRLHDGMTKQSDWARRIYALAEDAGAAGAFWFTWSDNWLDARSGQAVQGWKFGLVDESGAPHVALTAMAEGIREAAAVAWPNPPCVALPVVSVLVCTRNGAAHLPRCLQALRQIDYPDYEVIVVDDGSTDGTPGLVRAAWPEVRLVQTAACGLGHARNQAAAHARGKILAYLDDDCEPDAHWLQAMVTGMNHSGYDAAGGPNLAPPGASGLQSVLDCLPGLATHVMLDDEHAEHLPGCNLVVRSAVFHAVGGFDARFQTAGDDVDFCWRLLQHGFVLGFIPTAVVWHHRRSSIVGTVRQQIGYGRAEALLAKVWGSRVGPTGARWEGVVYGAARTVDRVYRGPFGYGAYPQTEMSAAMPRPPVRAARWQRFAHRWLSHLQPMARALGRCLEGLPGCAWPDFGRSCTVPPMPIVSAGAFWHAAGATRDVLLAALPSACSSQGWQVEADTGWQDWDFMVRTDDGRSVLCTTVTEYDEKPGRITRWRLSGDSEVARTFERVLRQVAQAAGFVDL